MDSLVVVLGFFCGIPFLFFWIGWFVRGWASRYKITRREQVVEDAGYAQVTPPADPSPRPTQTERVKRVRATPDR